MQQPLPDDTGVYTRDGWEYDSSTFKINQNFATYYARMFMFDNPQHQGFFRTKELRGKV